MNLPGANVTIDAEAGALAGGTGFNVVISPVALNDDATPRVFASFKGILAQHGYSPGADYSAYHIEQADKPVIFVGIPIATPGVVGRQNDEGVLGSCTVTATAGADGALEEVEGIVLVTQGGTVGTDQIILSLSLDGGFTFKKVKLGTGTSYVIPYVGITLNFGAGTLLVDDEFTFSSTAPKGDSDGLLSARLALAAQQKLARTWMVVWDISTLVEAQAILTQANAYKTAHDRSVVARAQLRDRLPLARKSKISKKMTGNPSLTFAEVGATGDTITRATGSWIDDGFVVGDIVTVTGSASNNVTGVIAALSATVLTFNTTDLANEGPVADITIIGGEVLTFAEVGATGDTITRSSGSWLADGFRVGDVVTVDGTSGGTNDVTGAIAALTATVLTFNTTDLVNETIASHLVDVVKGEEIPAWVSALDAEFEDIDAAPRINLGIGRGRLGTSPLHGWNFRRSVQWGTSIRAYQKDVHVPTWRKEDGPLAGVSLTDTNGNIVEFDERTDGGALAARFTCYRTWGNGPEGTFVAMDLTRDVEGSPIAFMHNMAVTNIAETIIQSETEDIVGNTLVLDAEHHALPSELTKREERVNSALKIALLEEKVPGEGPRASKATWTASRDDDLSGTDATLTGAADLIVNGTVVHVETVLRVR
jgi:hypothetical protein